MGKRLTATQLRNARKKRAKQKAQAADPSLAHIEDPKQAPTVLKARSFFQALEKKFKVHLGPTEGARTGSF